MNAYPASWYAATVNDQQSWAPIEGEHYADTAVIGAGLAGLTTALELTRTGQSVILLDSHQVAWGASGRNGGFVIPGFSASTESIIKFAGIDVAARLYQYSCLGVEYVRRHATQWGQGLIMGDGLITVSRHASAASNKQEADLLNSQYGQSVETWQPERVRSVLHSGQYFDAQFDPSAFHIHPLNYARRLAVEFDRVGGRLFEQSKVLSLGKKQSDYTRLRWQCQLDNALVSCDNVVLCTSAYGHTIYPSASRAVLPVATYVAVTEPLPVEQHQLIATSAAVADTRLAGDYYRIVDEQRLLWGGKITTRQSVPRQLERSMQKTIGATYPELSAVNIDYAWSGLMGYARHKMPLVGQLEPGVWVATAFGGHGLNTTAMAGCLVADGIVNNDQRWRDFSVFGPVWAGGLAGRCGVQLSYWGMQLADRLAESGSARKT